MNSASWSAEALSQSFSLQDGERIPLFTFDVGNGQGTYGFCLPNILLWIQLAGIMVLEGVFGMMVGILVYYTVVEPRKGRKPGPPLLTSGLLISLGLFLPFWIFVPMRVANAFGITNKIVRFCTCLITPTLSIFRTLEALFGFTPQYKARSVGEFALNFGSAHLLRFDTKANKYIRATHQSILQHFGTFVGMLFFTGLYQSCFFILPLFPSLGGNVLPDGFYHWQRIFDVVQWKDTLLVAFLNLFYLTTFGEGLSLITNLVIGIQTVGLNVYPLTASKSPSDFWGRRWNRLIHEALKGGVYKPVRSLGESNGTAVLAAFVASGLFHEWLLPATFIDYAYTHGPTMIFFVWQAVLMAGEAAIGHWTIFTLLSKNLPTPVRSVLVLMLSLPLAHFFCDSYVHSSFFLDGAPLFFMIEPVK